MLINMKNFKTFYEVQTASHPKEIIQPPHQPPPPPPPPPPHPFQSDKNLLRLWNKDSLTEIHRII